MNKCIGLIGKIFGHKFEARYNEECGEGQNHLPDHITLALGAREAVDIIQAEKSRKITYIYDVCIRCGEIIERGKND